MGRGVNRRHTCRRVPVVALVLVALVVLLTASLFMRKVGEEGGLAGTRALSGETAQDPKDGGRGPSGENAEDGSSDVSADASKGQGPVDLVSQVISSKEVLVTSEEGEVPQVAGQLLQSYKDRGDCVLAQAGYLDLFGSVWGCVINGGSWVDVCLVSDAGGGESHLSVVHLDAKDVAAELLGGNANDGGRP